jgi:polyisoprenoid-binding protein YceI
MTMPTLPVLVLLLATAFPANAREYVLRPETTNVRFSYHQMGFLRGDGRIGKASGTGAFDPDRPQASSVEVRLDMSSLTIGAGWFDGKLHGPDYFDVARYPQATFRSTRVVATGADTATITGELTLHGVTRKVVLTAVCRRGEGALTLNARTRIRRSDFGIDRDRMLIGDDIDLDIAATAVAMD